MKEIELIDTTRTEGRNYMGSGSYGSKSSTHALTNINTTDTTIELKNDTTTSSNYTRKKQE